MGFQKAKREQLWIKALLAGPSGSGKTYSALRLAIGLAKACGSRVAAVDTENGRIRYYANEFDFDDLQLDAPYTPEKYIQAIDDAVDGGYKVLIIDSITHEWDYCIDVHDKMPGNSYTNWGKITPRHDAFMEKILQSPIHVISTVRGKDTYVMEEKNGKQVPKKVGMGYKQRDNTEYNYTLTFNIAQDTHIAEALKDNTHLFEGRYEVLTEKDGKALYDWANAGEKPTKAPTKSTTPKKATTKEEPVEDDAIYDSIETLVAEIDTVAKALSDSGVDKSVITQAITEFAGTANYRKITDCDIAIKVLNALNNIKVLNAINNIF